MKSILQISSISDLAKNVGFEMHHPLISIVDLSKVRFDFKSGTRVMTDFYQVYLKNYCVNEVIYGRKRLDFKEGNLMCLAPNQVLTVQEQQNFDQDNVGWALFFHPDLVKGTSLWDKFKKYSFFLYEVSETLHLSEKEKNILNECARNIQNELLENIDSYSQNIITSSLEVFLNYCLRYYGRQFITRKSINNNILIKIENFLDSYYKEKKFREKGLLTVKELSEQVSMSPNYMSDLIKKETGMNAQGYIHYYLIEEAKNLLLSSDDSISEIAYNLGFEYPQYFGKLFKRKTKLTPLEYRNSKN